MLASLRFAAIHPFLLGDVVTSVSSKLLNDIALQAVREQCEA